MHGVDSLGRTSPLIVGTTLWAMADDPGNPPKETELSGPALSSGERKRVGLLVEDNLADVLLVQDAIEYHNLPVELHVVDDGDAACQFFERAEIDPDAPCPEFLLLDLNLPKRSGKEVLQRVRQSEKCKHVPVLIITSSDLSKDREELSALGANRYFRKPSNYEGFLKVGEVLKELLRNDRLN